MEAGTVGARRNGAVVRAASRRPVRSTRTAVNFDPLLPYDAWKGLGAKLGVYSNATAWWLGDWLVFGRMKYGRRYKDAVEATGLDYQTLRNYAVVSRRFEPARRRPALTFQHHAELCALTDEEQDRWLDLAGEGRWSRNELRRRVRAAAAAGLTPASEDLRLSLERERVARWRAAADRSSVDLQAWVVRTLDAAAGAVLEPGDR